MKILLFNYEYPPLGGGAANATQYLLKEFAKMDDVEVDLITSSVGKNYQKETIRDGITIHRLPIGKNTENLNYQSARDLSVYAFKAYFFAREITRQKKFDLSHSFFTVPCGVISYLLFKQRKLPYIVSLRGADVPGFSERFAGLYVVLRPIIVQIWKSATDVVACSKALRDLARKSNPKQEMRTIYNGIDTKRFRPEAYPDEYDRSFEILCASRLSRRKGFRYAIDAFAIIAEKYPNARLRISGGDGNATADLKKQVQDHQLNSRVTFTGQYAHDQAPEIYMGADAFVMPSLNEGMSNNLLEALASGLPVIVTPTGGAEELVSNGDNGFIVPMKNPEAIAQRLGELIENQGMARTMGRKSRAIAEKMSWGAAASQYRDLYHKTLE